MSEPVTDEELAAYLTTHACEEMTLDELQAHERTGALLAPRMAKELARFRAPVNVEGEVAACVLRVVPGGSIRSQDVANAVRPHVERAAQLAREAEGLRGDVAAARLNEENVRAREAHAAEVRRTELEAARVENERLTRELNLAAKLLAAERGMLSNVEATVGALREQVRGTANRLRLAEEAMQRALAERDELRNKVLSFIERMRPSIGAVVHVCRFLASDGAPNLCALCGNSRTSHPKGDGR